MFAPLCEGTFERNAEDYKGKREDVDESIGETFHESAAVVIRTCGRHCVRCLPLWSTEMTRFDSVDWYAIGKCRVCDGLAGEWW